MRLNEQEKQALKESGGKKPIKCWRYELPKACSTKHAYSTDGDVYTVLDVRTMTPADVMRTQGKGVYEALRVSWPESAAEIYMVVLLKGDWTDKPRFMQPTGRKSGDYTAEASRAMRDVAGREPESLSETDLDRVTKEAREKSYRRRDNRVRSEAVRAQQRSWSRKRIDRV